MTDDLRALLADVAEGRMDPTEAARRLSELDPSPPAAAADPWAEATADTVPLTDVPGSGTAAPSSAAGAGTAGGSGATANAEGAEAPVSRVVVQASARPVRVVADPSVTTVSVEGPHTVRRDGGTLRVEVPVTPGNDTPGSYRFERKTGLSRWISQATLFGVPLTVRINPDLSLEAEVMAGSLEVSGLHGALGFSVTAGSVKATDCTGPFTGTIRAGSAKLDVRPTSGASTVRVESGSVALHVQPGSDVRVRARAELGEVKLSGADGTSARVVDKEGSYEAVVGAGTASIDLDVVMGSVKVRLP